MFRRHRQHGLESLSRGAKQAIFFEQERGATQMLRENLQALDFKAKSRVIVTDIFLFFRDAAMPPADVIFLDPPYRYLRDHPIELQKLSQTLVTTHMHDESLLIFRHDAADKLQLPQLEVAIERNYGGMVVEILRKAE